MKKIIIGVVALGLIGAAAFFLRRHSDDETILGVPTPTLGLTHATPTPSSASATYKDGAYTGETVETDRGYGPVQIKAVISGGKITDIIFLQMPNLPGHTTEVTAFSQPLLKEEAITAQNASIDTVSGATQTTEAFEKSLASALALAK
ncbi:MAG TPA: FMN-binding protein [Patescibacteria group bacterium]|nr:FMN-binding protein [Patescibacteria group bacterium]